MNKYINELITANEESSVTVLKSKGNTHILGPFTIAFSP